MIVIKEREVDQETKNDQGVGVEDALEVEDVVEGTLEVAPEARIDPGIAQDLEVVQRAGRNLNLDRDPILDISQKVHQ